MPDVFMVATAAALWVVVLQRFPDVLARGDAAGWSLWCVFAIFAVDATLQVDAVWRAASGPLNGHGAACLWLSLAVLAAAAARHLVVATEGRVGTRPARAHLVLGAIGVVVVGVSYAAAPVDDPVLSTGSSPALVEQASLYAGGAWAALRWAVWLAFLTWALSGCVRITADFAGQARQALTPERLHTALSIGTAGCLLGYGYVAVKVVVVVAWLVGRGPELLFLDIWVAQGFTTCSVLLLLGAATYGAITRTADALLEALSRLRLMLRLRGLARLLHATAPEAGADSVPAITINERLAERVVGIRDRQLALSRYVPTETRTRALEAAQAAGYRGDVAYALAEAAWLEAARQAKQRGAAPLQGSDWSPLPGRGDGSLEQEARWLEQVAAAHKTSRVVRDFIERDRQGAA